MCVCVCVCVCVCWFVCVLGYVHHDICYICSAPSRCLYDAAMNLPTFCAECFIIPHVPEKEAEKPPSNVFDGFDMSVIRSAVGFMDHRLVRSAGTQWAHIHSVSLTR